MFVEGYIDREFLRIITEAGFDVIWKCETQDDVRKHGYEDAADRDGIDISKETIARIFIDADMEDYLMPTLTADLAVGEADRQKLLPLMVVCGNERMRDYAEQELKATKDVAVRK
jgi:anaerobic selenocysteine-containing dehydrogenase